VPPDDDSPHPLGQRDAAALVGLLAVLEGHLITGDLDRHVIDHLNSRLRIDGLVGRDAGPAELRLALADLNHRVRYALGEYDEPPAPGTGEVEQYFGFSLRSDAQAFTEAVPSAGTPVAVDGRAYDGDVGWQVAVRTTALPLSAEFDLVQQRLRALAAAHGGRDGGWGNAPA